MDHRFAIAVRPCAVAVLVAASAVIGSASAGPFYFSTGNVDGRMAAATRPSSAVRTEIEAADDFVISGQTQITSATFTGLLTGSLAVPTIGEVVVEIYRVFPGDSTNPPAGTVPTRVNSPSDVAMLSRDSTAGSLTFSTTTLAADFSAANSVLNGINPMPNQTTGGNGPVRGTEVQFNVTFATPINLGSDHYFFVPQVQVTGGEFYWLSSVRPIVAPGTPFSPDLQAWIRNENLSPDWLRIGTDIVGGNPAPTFNEAFTLTGQTGTVPEPAPLALLIPAVFGLFALRRRNLRPAPH
jgi:hypothetical protein